MDENTKKTLCEMKSKLESLLGDNVCSIKIVTTSLPPNSIKTYEIGQEEEEHECNKEEKECKEEDNDPENKEEA